MSDDKDKEKEIILLVKKLITLYIQLTSNSKMNKKILPEAFKDLKELNLLEKKLEQDSEKKAILGSISLNLEKGFNMYKFELDNENHVLDTFRWIKTGKLYLNEGESGKKKFKEIFFFCFELFMHLKYHSWDNDILGPIEVLPISKILHNVKIDNDRSKKKIDLYITMIKAELYPSTTNYNKEVDDNFRNVLEQIKKARKRSSMANLIHVLGILYAKLDVDQEQDKKKLDWLGNLLKNSGYNENIWGGGQKKLLKMHTVFVNDIYTIRTSKHFWLFQCM